MTGLMPSDGKKSSSGIRADGRGVTTQSIVFFPLPAMEALEEANQPARS